ncbi:MAG: peptidoglycan-binding protein, partial [bacterium]
MQKFVKFAVAALVVAVVFAAALPAAKAATAAELEATIKALQAQIAALGAGSSAGSAAADYTPFEMNLKLGSKGDDVTRLQQYLEESGDLTMPEGADYGYFGAATKKAVIAYQEANDISPASGNFGPLTREAVNADLEAKAAAVVETPATPEVTGSTTAPTVMSGDGSLTATVKSSPSDTQTLKEGQTKDIMALELKATGGDVSANRIKIKFNKRAWLYFGKVTLKDAAGIVIAEKALDSSMEEVTSGSDYRLSFEDFTPIVVKQGEKK